jgi:hypothetical protein
MAVLAWVLDRIADWVVAGIEFSTSRPKPESETWEPAYKEDPL